MNLGARKATVRNEDSVRLSNKFPNFSRELLDRLVVDPSCKPTIDALNAVKKKDFSEDYPLLMVIPYINDQNSIDYVNCGNYGLQPLVPGYAPWPGINA